MFTMTITSLRDEGVTSDWLDELEGYSANGY